MGRPQSSPHHPQPCRAEGCADQIWLCPTLPGRAMPLNPAVAADTDPAGIVAVSRDQHGTYHARVLKAGEQPGPAEKRYVPHWKTCTNPDDMRRPKTRKQRAARAVREAGQPAQLTLTLGDEPR